MADAWSTVVTHDPEWDDYGRSRALALAAWESKRCPNCHNYDCLIPLTKDLRHVTWDEHGGEKFEVSQYRCLACGASAIIERDWNARHENDKPTTGQASARDGRVFIVRPLTEED